MPQALRGTTAKMWVLLDWMVQTVFEGSLSWKWPSWDPNMEVFSTATVIVDSLQVTLDFTAEKNTDFLHNL